MSRKDSLGLIKCKICKVEKESSEFYKNKIVKSGIQSRCKDCCRKKVKSNVYIITNPAYPDYVKIGRAKSIEGRLKSYQTGSPFRDYEVYFYVLFDNVYILENYFKANFECLNEWVRISPEDAKQEILRIIKER